MVAAMAVAVPLGEARTRAVVAERSMGLCEVRLDIDGICRGMAESKHHRRKVGQGGLWDPTNIVDVCGHGTIGCHGYLEANPVTARQRGLWLYAGQTPEATPARLSFRGMVNLYLLHSDGSITWLSSEAVARLRR